MNNHVAYISPYDVRNVCSNRVTAIIIVFAIDNSSMLNLQCYLAPSFRLLLSWNFLINTAFVATDAALCRNKCFLVKSTSS